MFAALAATAFLASQAVLAIPFETRSTGGTGWSSLTPSQEEALKANFSKYADADNGGADKLKERAVYAVSSMSAAQQTAYKPYTHLAASAYCATSSINSWSCGQHCSALPGMVIYASGGDNESTPDWYVGYLPSLGSAVVVHQGTTPSNLESDYVDANYFLENLPSGFPGIPSAVQVHEGFLGAQQKTASAVLSSVRKIFSDHGVSKVACVGHSLGGAIAILDALYLHANLPSSTSFKVVTYGQPRVGNQDFANYVDATFSDNSRITHNEDIVPIVPGRFLGFVHSGGEKHIDPSVNWWACSGQDNEADPQCSTGEVDNIFDGSVSDHDGPYDDGITMGC